MSWNPDTSTILTRVDPKRMILTVVGTFANLRRLELTNSFLTVRSPKPPKVRRGFTAETLKQMKVDCFANAKAGLYTCQVIGEKVIRLQKA